MYVQLINNIYIKIKFMESLTPLKDLFLKEVILIGIIGFHRFYFLQ